MAKTEAGRPAAPSMSMSAAAAGDMTQASPSWGREHWGLLAAIGAMAAILLMRREPDIKAFLAHLPLFSN